MLDDTQAAFAAEMQARKPERFKTPAEAAEHVSAIDRIIREGR